MQMLNRYLAIELGFRRQVGTGLTNVESSQLVDKMSSHETRENVERVKVKRRAPV